MLLRKNADLCVMLSPELRLFIQEHLQDEPERLLLSAGRYPDVDVRMAAQQIAARQHIREKLPEWYTQPELIFPSALSCQQASSELTAKYKQELMPVDGRIYDLTGGLGVDSYYFSQRAKSVLYMEQQPELYAAAVHNFAALGAQNIQALQGSCLDLLPTLPSPDMIYIDPSRRGTQRQRLLSLEDYEPCLDSLRRLVFPHAARILLKISPMADIWESLRLLPEATEVHVLSVKNDCKELLFLLAPQVPQQLPPEAVKIVCVHWGREEKKEFCCFRRTDEQAARTQIRYGRPEPGGYVYEPNASLLKAGAFQWTALQFGLEKLAQHSHLYTSSRHVQDFPGRVFRIVRLWPFRSSGLHKLKEALPQANIAVRNFPLGAEALRKRLQIKDGGNNYLFGTTLQDGERVLIQGEMA